MKYSISPCNFHHRIFNFKKSFYCFVLVKYYSVTSDSNNGKIGAEQVFTHLRKISNFVFIKKNTRTIVSLQFSLHLQTGRFAKGFLKIIFNYSSLNLKIVCFWFWKIFLNNLVQIPGLWWMGKEAIGLVSPGEVKTTPMVDLYRTFHIKSLNC